MCRRTLSIVFAFALILVLPVGAQIPVVLHQDLLTRSDTVWVDVRLGADAELNGSVIAPVNAYSFTVQTSVGLEFIRSDESYTLTDRDGWSSAFSARNGRVGGFASSQNALVSSGVLIRLQFLLKGTDTYEELELYNFRLNSGDPDHIPTVPSLRIDLESHIE
jgi:hypothetical protein